ncbi:MAG: hypothetical protein EXS63_00910 [Candidatus Omnitrophica bacterium]|nr:hypothetical protein [Candidatus Omnitrophota bacterium]
MYRQCLLCFITLVLAGCARTNRDGIISKQLPLTVGDLAEIRAGEKNHEEVMAQYELLDHPDLQSHLSQIAANVAEVSIRPHLPYKVYVLDSDEVNAFGGPGGYIYMTRGLLQFVESESEIAGVVAHEIAHIANHEYDNIPSHAKIQRVYGMLLSGSEFASGAIGTYGTAAKTGLRGLGSAAPKIVKRFSKDEEIVADESTIRYLLKAGYDPFGYAQFVDRLTKIPMSDVNRFVIFLNTHPPFQDRQNYLANALKKVNRKEPEIEFKKDALDEIRQLMNKSQEKPIANASIMFQPSIDAHPNTSPHPDQEEPTPAAPKHGAWF